MGYIIRNRLLSGNSTVDGNNPFTIQGHPVSTRVVGQQEGIKDFLDLTDQILTIPRELSHYRYDSPLMGGSVTVKNHSGPVNDYLATQYLTEKPPQGYMGPENRPAEIPEITIGKAGTFDVKLVCSIWTQSELEKIKTADNLKKGLISKVYYNLADFDDANAPAMPVEIPDGGYKLQVLTPTPAEALEKVPECARIVGFVKLLEGGIKVAEDARTAFRAAGGDPCEIRQKVGWFEIQVVKEIDGAKIGVLGAKLDDKGTTFVMNRKPSLPDHARIPPERIWIEVPTASDTNISLPSVFVPVWDITNIKTTKEGADTLRTTVKFKLNGKEKELTIDTHLDAEMNVVTHHRIVPMRPLFPKEYRKATPALESHPFFPDTVFPYVRIETFRDDGFHYAAFADTVEITEAIKEWAPNTVASAKIKIGAADRQARLPLGWVYGAVASKKYLIDPKTFVFEAAKDFNDTVATKQGTDDHAAYTQTGGAFPKGVRLDGATGAITGKWTDLTPDDRKVHEVTIMATKDTVTQAETYKIEVERFLSDSSAVTVPKDGVKSIQTRAIGEDVDGVDYAMDPVIKGFAMDPKSGVITAVWPNIPEDLRGLTVKIDVTAWNGNEIATKVFDTEPWEIKIASGDAEPPESVEKSTPQPLVCTRITATVLRKPCQGPEDLEVLAWLSDGSSEVLSMDEYAIVSTAAGVMTLALASDPSIVAKVKIM